MAVVLNDRVTHVLHVLHVLAESARQSFDDDRTCTERDLYANFKYLLREDKELLSDLGEIPIDESVGTLLSVVENYVTKPHWEGNNFETLSDAFRAFNVNRL